MADVRIETTNDLPDPIGFAVEFGPGFIHVAMRPDADAGAVMCEAVTAVIDSYPIEEIRQLRPAPARLLATA